MKIKIFIMHIICAIVEADYLDHDVLIKWSDELIGKVEILENWLVEVSLSNSNLEILKIVKKEINNNQSTDNVVIDELYLGFVYKEFLSGKIDYEVFRKKISDNYYTGMGVFNEDDINLYFFNKEENLDLAVSFERKLNDFLIKSESALDIFFSNDLYFEINKK